MERKAGNKRLNTKRPRSAVAAQGFPACGRFTALNQDELRRDFITVACCMNDGLLRLNQHGRITGWNPAAERIFGDLLKNAAARELPLLFPAENRKECAGYLEKIRNGEPVGQHETVLAGKDGKLVDVELTIQPIMTAGGKVRGAWALVHDITEHKQVVGKLQASEAFYHSLVENLPQNIFRKDAQGRFTFANQRFCQMLKRPLEEIIGKTDFDFYPEPMARKFQEDDRRVMETGELFETVEQNQVPGGRTIYVQVCKIPLRDAAGRTMGVQGIFWDITATIEAELALKRSEERYKTLLSSVTDYIYTVELKNGKPVATRHGPGCLAVTGYSPEDFESEPYLWHLMIHEDDRDAVMEQLKRVMEGKAEPLEHRIIHRDGSIRWVRNTQVPRFDEQGRLVAYDGLISDITARKEAEERLKETNAELLQSRQTLTRALEELNKSHEELKAAYALLIRAEKMESVGRLAAGVAHEVKNFLATLLAGIEYLEKTPAMEDPNAQGVIKDMRHALQRSNTVIRDMLDFAASQELEISPESLNELIQRAAALLRHDFKQAEIKVQLELAEELPPILADRNKVEQVFINLFLNAIHAMENGGTLVVRTRQRVLEPGETVRGEGVRDLGAFQPGDTVVVAEIDDTGPGIPPENLDKIFDPFFTTKPPGKGTGLGLAVCRKILEMHNAIIKVTNRPEGGARATVTFKAARRS